MVFPECERQMVSITISPRGKSREKRLSQVDEYLIAVYVGAGGVVDQEGDGNDDEVRWRYLRRNDVESARGTRKGGPNQFYPIYVDNKTHCIVSIGAPLGHHQDPCDVPAVRGATAVFPVREDGKHMNWGLTGPSLRRALDAGYVRVTPGAMTNNLIRLPISQNQISRRLALGTLRITGHRPDGSNIVVITGGKKSRPTTSWRRTQHDAGAYGTGLLRAVLPEKQFPSLSRSTLWLTH
jgi:adenine-specific DNA-methyltransferase